MNNEFIPALLDVPLLSGTQLLLADGIVPEYSRTYLNSLYWPEIILSQYFDLQHVM